jgi:hypothetical protein
MASSTDAGDEIKFWSTSRAAPAHQYPRTKSFFVRSARQSEEIHGQGFARVQFCTPASAEQMDLAFDDGINICGDAITPDSGISHAGRKGSIYFGLQVRDFVFARLSSQQEG